MTRPTLLCLFALFLASLAASFALAMWMAWVHQPFL